MRLPHLIFVSSSNRKIFKKIVVALLDNNFVFSVVFLSHLVIAFESENPDKLRIVISSLFLGRCLVQSHKYSCLFVQTFLKIICRVIFRGQPSMDF